MPRHFSADRDTQLYIDFMASSVCDTNRSKTTITMLWRSSDRLFKVANRFYLTTRPSGRTYYPYRKPNNETLYIDTNSNHPPTIINPAAIGRQISDISSNKELFNKAKPHYESALYQSGHNKNLTYTERKTPVTYTAHNSRKNRQRNLIWFIPPYNMNVQTDIGRDFLDLVRKHFRETNGIFNKQPAQTTC